MDFSAYANQWQFLDNVQDGTLKPRQPTLPDITSVKYRPGAVTRPMQAFLNGAQIVDQTMAVAIWPSTAGGYSPKATDEFVDVAGQAWIVLTVASDPADPSVSCLLQMQQK